MKTQSVKIALVGAAGRMGQRMLSIVREETGYDIVAAVEKSNPALSDLSEKWKIPFTDSAFQALSNVDICVDFSAPPALDVVLDACLRSKKPYLIASTGLNAEHLQHIKQATSSIPILVAANLSLGINVMTALVSQATNQLGVDFNVEICEMHHKLKRDAPSGTAKQLAHCVQSVRNESETILGRQGENLVRVENEIGIAALRGGDCSGEHTVYFLGSGERLEITHRSTTPDIFVRGALRVVDWLRRQSPGYYTMRDLLTS